MRKLLKKSLIPHEDNSFKPYFLRAEAVILMLLLLMVVVLSSQIYNGLFRGKDFISAVLPGALAELANTERTENAVPALNINAMLIKAAQLKADDMAKKGYFSHISPDGHAPWYWFLLAGYNFSYAGENLAIDFNDTKEINQAWMDSSEHRANILNSHFKDIGVAAATGTYQGHEAIFVVEMFGTPAAKKTVSAPVSKPAQLTVSKNITASSSTSSVNATHSSGSSTSLAFFSGSIMDSQPISAGKSSSGQAVLRSIFFSLYTLIIGVLFLAVIQKKHFSQGHNLALLFVFAAGTVLIFLLSQKLFPISAIII